MLETKNVSNFKTSNFEKLYWLSISNPKIWTTPKSKTFEHHVSGQKGLDCKILRLRFLDQGCLTYIPLKEIISEQKVVECVSVVLKSRDVTRRTQLPSKLKLIYTWIHELQFVFKKLFYYPNITKIYCFKLFKRMKHRRMRI